MKIGKFRMRVKVTSIISSKEEMLVFNGMSVNKEKLFSNVSARSYITVKIAASRCNSMPRKGQVWMVFGAPEVLEVPIGRFIVSNIVFDQPEQAEMVIPETIEEFKEFIAKDREFKGIGNAEAAKLFNEFGLDLFDMLNSNDLSKIEAHPKLCKHIPSLVRGWNKYENLRYASYFVDLGIPPTVQQLLFKFHNNKTINTIKKNPYVLLTFGMKFKVVDTIAREKFNIPADDLNRTLAIVENAMRCFVNQGHTCVKLDTIHSKLSTELNGDNEAFRVLLDSKRNLGVHYNYITDTVHSTPYFIMEDVIARRIIKLASSHVELDTTYDKALNYALSQIPFELNEKQLHGVQKALSNEYSCIVGRAGTGKTTVLEAVTKAYAYLDFDIYPLALSGRAAMRLQESVEYPTQTIASFIYKQILAPNRPILVIIDEASMVDVLSMYSIIMHIPPDARLLLVGDSFQLAPIGAGLVLSELVKTLPYFTTELTVIKRQDESTGVPEYSKAIREQRVPKELSYKGIKFIDADKQSIPDICIQLMRDNAQVICATRKMAGNINQRMQEKLNTGSFIRWRGTLTRFKVGDPVIFNKNDYELGVQNGSLGRIIGFDSDTDELSIQKDVAETITVTHFENLELSYAITLHKAQGSQFKTVIVVLENNKMLVDNSWIYTATTRVVERLFILGKAKDMADAICRPSATSKREVFLSELIIKHSENIDGCLA